MDPVVFVAVLVGSETGEFPEEVAEGLAVAVPDIEHDLIYTAVRGLERLFGGFDLGPLNVFQRGVVGGFFEPANKVPTTEGDHGREFLDGKLLFDMLLDIGLGIEYRLVLVFLLPPENRELRLVDPVDVDLKVFGAGNGHFAAGIFLDQIQNEVEE